MRWLMSELYPVEVDHDYDRSVVDVEFHDGSVKSYDMKFITRDQAVKMLREWVVQELKKEDAVDRLRLFVRFTENDDKNDYEIEQDIYDLTGDYGYCLADQ
jgi:hypothetical protein